MYQLCKTFSSISQQMVTILQQTCIAYFEQFWIYDD